MMASDSGPPELAKPRVSVIVPARNEEACLGACLESLAAQQGVDFEILVVDDGSTDRTPEIARSFAGARLIQAEPLAPGWSGKSNAVASGARQARGEWLLFTDADTVHLPGSLARSLREAEEHGADLLSYSPQQEVHGFWEKAVMPVIFAELASVYRPAEVGDPGKAVAAANGQYLLISRRAYQEAGGHAVARGLLEDVELARAVKRCGRRIRFRYGGDAVRTRMYRSLGQLAEGWTKNLALLFSSPGELAALRAVEFVLIAGGATVAAASALQGAPLRAAFAGMVAGGSWLLFLRRIRRAHFAWDANLLALFGLPVFALLLAGSRLSHKRGQVRWKGRSYDFRGEKTGAPAAPVRGSHAQASPAAERADWL